MFSFFKVETPVCVLSPDSDNARIDLALRVAAVSSLLGAPKPGELSESSPLSALPPFDVLLEEAPNWGSEASLNSSPPSPSTAASTREGGGGGGGTGGGHIDASRAGPGCLPSPASAPFVVSEDCLTLDVYAPASALRSPNRASLPVVVYIFGGSLVSGCTSRSGPLDALVERASHDNRPFVLLAMNYRLGALGFAAVSELAEGDPRGTSGNYGFLDQILALQWARDNIAAFGGDPQQVTLMGHSSGGTSIFALLAAPAAQGLFHAALTLSGSPNVTMARSEKEEQDRALWLPGTGCAAKAGAELAQCLREADALTLQNALPQSYMEYSFDKSVPDLGKGSLGWSSLAFVDGVTIARPVHEALSSGVAGNVSVLFQNVQCENPPERGSEAYLATHLAKFATGKELDPVFSEYAALAKSYAPEDERSQYSAAALVADTSVTCGTVSLAAAAARGQAPGVFVGTVVRGASHAKRDLSCVGIAFSTQLPFHRFDLDLVLAWADARGSADVWQPPMWCPFKPSSVDVQLAEVSWADVRQSEAASNGAYSHALLGGTDSGGTVNVVDWKLFVCSSMEEMGIGQPYWWIN
mmetsp:Transcript_180186/g.571835  ORF Transcript_180186/g.571835 Transcript_180186/m.571835 type:complete len:584 (+) Transcript_180186:227-1978(+)